jgi:hypothetical protein
LFFGKSFIAVQCKKLHSNAKNFKVASMIKVKVTTKQIAIIAVFGAIYAVLRALPSVPMIGVAGAYFSVSDILAPIYGIILGPFIGGASVLIGTFTAMTVKAPVFLGLDFLPGFINAVALGFLVRRKWLPVVVLNVILLIGFVANPLTVNLINVPLGVTNITVPFAWLHIVALVLLISPVGLKATQWVQTLKSTKAISGFAILALIGTMMQHLMGNILYENIFVYVNKWMTPESLALNWNVVFYLYPWERLMLVLLAVVIGIPLIRALQKTALIPKSSAPIPESNYKSEPKTNF